MQQLLRFYTFLIVFCIAVTILSGSIYPKPTNAQKITNIRVSQEGDNVVITYDLTGALSGQTFDVQVVVSSDRGRSFLIVPLTLTGDLKEVKAGTGKKITWRVLNDRSELAGEGFVFKLVATLKTAAIINMDNSSGIDSKNSIMPEMVLVQGGTFQMGSTTGKSGEQQVHSVTLSSYYIGKYEVTQAQWQAVTGSNPSYFKGTNLPVEKVSWNDVQQFITKLNQLTGKNYRLPTEAEWEYAARGGTGSKGYTYSGSNTLGDVAWYSGNSGSQTNPVGGKAANELGIYDMSGNVWEWCSDGYGIYGSPAQTNPTGPSTGSTRVIRGGSWFIDASYCRVAARFSSPPDYRLYFLGFRLVLSLP